MTEQERLANGALCYGPCDQGIMCCNRQSPDCEYYYDEMAEAHEQLTALLVPPPSRTERLLSWLRKWFKC